jgi:hypothetical protein
VGGYQLHGALGRLDRLHPGVDQRCVNPSAHRQHQHRVGVKTLAIPTVPNMNLVIMPIVIQVRRDGFLGISGYIYFQVRTSFRRAIGPWFAVVVNFLGGFLGCIATAKR